MTTRTPEQSTKIAQICLEFMQKPEEPRSVLAAKTILLLGTAADPARILLADMEPELRDLCAEYVDLAKHMVGEPAVRKLLEGVVARGTTGAESGVEMSSPRRPH